MTQVMPGAEPWEAEGSEPGSGSTADVGVLVLHGFTGNPQSMRPLAEALAAAGFAVSLPLLPGHGTQVEDMLPTRWADWSTAAEDAYQRLAARCRAVVVAGLSMGGTLTAWLGTRHPEIAGLVLVNPLIDGSAPGVAGLVDQLRAAGVELVPGIGSDIALEGTVESAYPMTPVQPLLDLHAALGPLVADLGTIRCPVLIFNSPQDHVVEPVSSDTLAAAVGGAVERVTLERSFHVATLDHDARLIEERAVEFVRRVTQD
ncbi:MAG TPA: alpha/beta fold hydrolase [Frankiaceae bacterium]|nr:alpha/beta fold hydrolase [Frankiaceae bacterium]